MITPWNFPFEIPVESVFAALASGNAVVVKPAEETPLTAYFLARGLAEAGFPDGAFNLVTGGSSTGATLVRHPEIQLIAFTGSAETGKDIARAAAGRNAECLLEMGGKDPILVLGDGDIPAAAEAIAMGSNYNAGQVCCATERVIAVEGVYDSLVEAVVEECSTLRRGDPFEEDTDIGPMINERIQNRVQDHVKDALQQGASLRSGGSAEGLFHEPTVLEDVSEEMRIAREETFGPVTPLIRVENYEQAIEAANNTPFGLQAAVFTNSLERAHDAANRIKAGGVFVNETNNYWERFLPFGGYKQSGNGGRFSGKWHLESLTRVKSVVMNYGDRRNG